MYNIRNDFIGFSATQDELKVEIDQKETYLSGCSESIIIV